MSHVDGFWSPFKPVDDKGGYLPLEDHGLIGDGATAALVGLDGAIWWMCLPRFDSPPVFCSILDRKRGGRFVMTPDGLVEARQRYEPDSGVLATEMRAPTGVVRVTDALTLRRGADLTEDATAARGELLRSATVLEGEVRLRISVQPRGGASASLRGDGLQVRCDRLPNLDLQLAATQPLDGLETVVTLRAGQQLHVVLRCGWVRHRGHDWRPDEVMQATLDSWRAWTRHFSYAGPHEPLVRRSAITLKLLDHFASGAIVAAPTSSLPEAIGGSRNWDYRYTWVRDAAFSVYALHRIGLHREAWGFLGWVLDAIDRVGGPGVMYDLAGTLPPAELVDAELEGYRRSPPVRWGNGAAAQRQNDVYGEIIDCAYQWLRGGGTIDPQLGGRLRTLAESARTVWRTPDQGIWEVRTPGRVFTYSAAMCHVALDRAAKMAEHLGATADAATWATEAAQVRQAILAEAWDPRRSSLTEHLGGGGLDASLLTLPLRRVIPATHPKMVATVAAITDRLGAGGGLLYRYLPEESPDGLAGHEGAFVLCSFWLVDNLALQGRLDEAGTLFDSLCARAGPLGLLSEQIDPTSGAFLGNYPQAFSHVGVISSGINLGRQLERVT